MLENKKLDLDYFMAKRAKILTSWPTGTDDALQLERAIETLKAVPKHKNFAAVLDEAKAKGITLTQPRAGVALVEDHIDLLTYLQNVGGADLLPSTIDAYTRHNRYDQAEDGIKASKREKRSMLNGFPAVNHGVAGCKAVLDAVDRPLQARHGTPDARLLSEIIHAAGWTSNEGGGISYNIPYAKNIALEDSIRYWQYADRLVGYYEEHGIRLNREPFGPLTGTLVPPCISHTVAIIEALLAAEQGVKHLTVGYGMGGHMIQDVAALQTLETLTTYYLKLFGYNDVVVTTVFHQWMGGFPADESAALALISMASVVASMGQATKMITKTPHESAGVPTKEANAQGLIASKTILNLMNSQPFPSSEALEREKALIKKEVDQLLYATLHAGQGDLAKGAVRAFSSGLIDIPFAPSEMNLGKILPARDHEGAIRIVNFGHLALDTDIKAIHQEALAKRAAKQQREINFQMTIDDVYAIAQTRLVGERA